MRYIAETNEIEITGGEQMELASLAALVSNHAADTLTHLLDGLSRDLTRPAIVRTVRDASDRGKSLNFNNT